MLSAAFRMLPFVLVIGISSFLKLNFVRAATAMINKCKLEGIYDVCQTVPAQSDMQHVPDKMADTSQMHVRSQFKCWLCRYSHMSWESCNVSEELHKICRQLARVAGVVSHFASCQLNHGSARHPDIHL